MPNRIFSRIKFHLKVTTFDDGYFFLLVKVPWSMENLRALKKLPNVFDIELID